MHRLLVQRYAILGTAFSDNEPWENLLAGGGHDSGLQVATHISMSPTTYYTTSVGVGRGVILLIVSWSLQVFPLANPCHAPCTLHMPSWRAAIPGYSCGLAPDVLLRVHRQWRYRVGHHPSPNAMLRSRLAILYLADRQARGWEVQAIKITFGPFRDARQPASQPARKTRLRTPRPTKPHEPIDAECMKSGAGCLEENPS